MARFNTLTQNVYHLPTFMVLLGFLFSCSQSQETSADDWSLQGAKHIEDFFKAKVTCVKSVGLTDKGMATVYMIDISESKIIDEVYKDRKTLAASNCAYRFFNYIPSDRLREVDQIHVHTEYSDESFIFQIEKLQLFRQKLAIVEQALEDIKSNRSRALANKLDSSIFNFSTVTVIDNLMNAEKQLGPFDEFILYGFEEITLDTNKTCISISGVLWRQKRPNNFRMIVSQNPKPRPIYYINYEL
jgi:hypothetical protein